jgi:tetratricopeptide (TPR) repeat protein
MTPPVFISYARIASAPHAANLAESLGNLAFLDTSNIDDGDYFPNHLLEALLNAKVVVIFATKAYSERRFCRLEMRLALAGGDLAATHLVVGIGDEGSTVLDAMPTSVAGQSWPPAQATARLLDLVHQRLANSPPALLHALSATEAQKLAVAFLQEANIPDTQALHDTVCSLPVGVASQSIGSRFVGRADELRRIHQILSEGLGTSASLTSRIAAAGGFGKTRLAVEYMYRYGPRYYPGGIFWVNAASSSIDNEFWRVLSTLDATVPDVATMHRQGRDIRRELESALRRIGQPALYVIDNIPEADRGEHPPSIADFCPALGVVTILATSRQDTREQGVRTIPVGTLKRDSAILLLTEGVPGTSRLSWVDWGRIAEWVGDLPIALDLINRCLALNAVTIDELQRCASAQGVMSPPTAELDRIGAALQGQVPANAIHGISQAFSISFAKLDDPAQKIAVLLAQFSPEPIPDEVVDALPTMGTISAIRAALRSRHFVNFDGPGSFGVMHRLMADFLRCISTNEAEELLKTASKVVKNIMTPERCNDPRSWQLMNLCRPHAEALFARGLTIDLTPVSAIGVGAAAGILASEQGDYSRARGLNEQVLERCMRTLGDDDPGTLMAKYNLATTLSLQGDRVRAGAILKQVVDARIRILGADHPHTLSSMNSLALSLSAQGKYAEAESFYRQVLETRTLVLGEHHPDTMIAMSNLALSVAELGDRETARRLNERVLELRISFLGEDHPDVVSSMHNLAAAFFASGDFTKARDLQEKTLTMMTRLWGKEHPDTLKAASNLAASLFQHNEYSQARSLCESVLESRKRVLGEDHPDTLRSKQDLAVALVRAGKLDAALAILRDCISSRRRVLGDTHPDTLDSEAFLRKVKSFRRRNK